MHARVANLLYILQKLLLLLLVVPFMGYGFHTRTKKGLMTNLILLLIKNYEQTLKNSKINPSFHPFYFLLLKRECPKWFFVIHWPG